MDDIVGNGVDGCIGVGIDGHDDGTLLHTYGVLYLSADTASDVELWTYGEPRLSYHTIVIYVTGIYGCAAGTHLSVQLFGQIEKQVENFNFEKASISSVT